jgi:enoyl-CoA hydratase/carnithine racemase
MENNCLLVEYQKNICTLTINRPDKRNALTPVLLRRLEAEMKSLQRNPQVRVVIIRGAGDKAFSSGYDISQIPTSENEREKEPLSPPRILTRALKSLEEYPYPIIGMLNGHTMGAGFELAATCDLRLTVDTALFAVPPAKLGALYSPSGTQRFIQILGVSYAKEILFTGSTFDALKAKEMGFVNQVFSSAELPKATYSLAQEIAENAPLSLQGAKKIISILLGSQKIGPADLEEMEALVEKCLQSEDLKEGQKAFLEKRKPNFSGF